ncbi:MAG: response regulator [Chloroflexota bacterium]
MTTLPPETTARPVILVAEDEESVRRMIGLVLRAAGYDSVLCADGLAAAERLEAGPSVDAVLMDLRMPRMGGMELVARIRQRPELRMLPVIAMSAYNDEVQEREAIAAGADAFLAKPFTIADLQRLLGTVLARLPR